MAEVLVLVSIAFGIARFLVPVSGKIERKDIFKDLAHIWVGLLIGVAIMEPMWWWMPVALTVLEVVAFIVRRKCQCNKASLIPAPDVQNAAVASSTTSARMTRRTT